MKLNFNVTKDDIPRSKAGRRGEIADMLKDFLISGKPMAELISDDGVDAKHRSNSIYIAIRRKKLPIILKRRGERIFLIRSEK